MKYHIVRTSTGQGREVNISYTYLANALQSHELQTCCVSHATMMSSQTSWISMLRDLSRLMQCWYCMEGYILCW